MSQLQNHGAEDQSREEDIQRGLEKLVEKKPEVLKEFKSFEMLMGSMGNPLLHKTTPEHISQALDLAAKHDERQYDLIKVSQQKEHEGNISNRRYGFSAFCVVVVLIIVILLLFRDKPEVLIPASSTEFVGKMWFGKHAKCVI